MCFSKKKAKASKSSASCKVVVTRDPRYTSANGANTGLERQNTAPQPAQSGGSADNKEVQLYRQHLVDAKGIISA